MIVSDSVKYIGVDDTDIDLFESQYLVPDGVSYNSYVILDDKITVMDTVDERKTDEWFSNLTEVLGDRQPDYLVISSPAAFFKSCCTGPPYLPAMLK